MIDFIAKKNPNDASFICENLISLFTSEKRVFSYLYKSLKVKIKKKKVKTTCLETRMQIEVGLQ